MLHGAKCEKLNKISFSWKVYFNGKDFSTSDNILLLNYPLTPNGKHLIKQLKQSKT